MRTCHGTLSWKPNMAIEWMVTKSSRRRATSRQQICNWQTIWNQSPCKACLEHLNLQIKQTLLLKFIRPVMTIVEMVEVMSSTMDTQPVNLDTTSNHYPLLLTLDSAANIPSVDWTRTVRKYVRTDNRIQSLNNDLSQINWHVPVLQNQLNTEDSFSTFHQTIRYKTNNHLLNEVTVSNDNRDKIWTTDEIRDMIKQCN